MTRLIIVMDIIPLSFTGIIAFFPEQLSSLWIFSGVHFAQSLIFSVEFCQPLLVFLSFFSLVWSLHCLSFFILWYLKTFLGTISEFQLNVIFVTCENMGKSFSILKIFLSITKIFNIQHVAKIYLWSSNMIIYVQIRL